MIPEKQIIKPSLSRKLDIFSHFTAVPTATGQFFSGYNFQTFITGTGAGFQSTPGELLNPGIIRLLSGTTGGTPGSRTGFRTDSCFITGSADIEVEFVFRATQVSTQPEDYEFWLGFGDSNSTVPNNGAYIYYDWSTSVNISANTTRAGTLTRVFSSTAMTTNWNKINILVPKAGTTARFTFNDADVVTISTNIPSQFGVQMVFSKYLGSINHGLDIDYIRTRWTL